MTPVMKSSGLWAIEELHGGPLLAAHVASFVVFWHWESGEIVRRIDVEAKSVSLVSSRTLYSASNLAHRSLGRAQAISSPSPRVIRITSCGSRETPTHRHLSPGLKSAAKV